MSDFVVTINEAELAAILADFYGKSNDQRPNDFFETTSSVVNTVNVGIAPPLPTVDNLQPTIDFATATVTDSVAKNGSQETGLVVTILETLDDAGELAVFIARQKEPAVWFGNIQIIMNGLTDAQRTTINSLDIGSQVSVTKSFPNSTPSTVTQLMALEGISHDITPDRHIVTLYPNPARIYTYFIVGGYTTTTTRTNLVLNPSFETNTTNWTAFGATISRVAGTFGTGSWVGEVVYNNTVGGGGYTETIAVTPSQSYTASATVLRTVGTRSYYVLLIYYNGATELIAFGSSVNTCAIATRMSATGAAPANATHARVFVYSSTASVIGDKYQVDSVLLETGSSALPYFDGTYADAYTGYTLTAQGWSGTVDASTSTATWGLTSSFVGSQLDDDTKGLG